MWLFKKKIKRAIEQTETDSARSKIGRGIIKLQTAFAERMNKAAARLPIRKMKTALVLFCLVSGGFSIYLAMNGVFGTNAKKNSFTIDQASVPKHFVRSGDEIKDGQNLIDDELYKQITTFKAYMDSLQVNDRKSYDSIYLSRPGLLDSVKAIEEIYLSQQIK
jgi:hypothetical protein